MTATPEPTADQLQHLFAELGRCLYLYQSIEYGLKVVLPHMVPPGDALRVTEGSSMDWRHLLDSKTTLGPLVQLLKERIESDSNLVFEEALRQLVEHRNEIIHHFVAQPFGHCRTKSEIEEAMQFLKVRRQFAAPIFTIVQQLTAGFIKMLDEIDANESPSH